METTQTKLSNVFNLISQADIRIHSYHFGQRWDINKNIYNNFDPDLSTGRLFPAVLFEVPDEVNAFKEPQYLDSEEEIDMILYFDTLQDYNNDSSANTLNLVEQWDALKIIAKDFMANFSLVIGVEKYNIGSIIGGVRYIQREMQHNQRLLTWEASFKLKINAPCTDDAFKINLDLLPDTIQETDIERIKTSSITPCQAIVATLENDDNLMACVSAEICGIVPIPDLYSMLFDTGSQFIKATIMYPEYELERTQPMSVNAWVKLDSIGAFNIIVSKFLDSINNRGWYFAVETTGKLRFSMQNKDFINGMAVNSIATITPGIWVCIGVTYNGNSQTSGVEFYINGIQQAKEPPLSDTLTDSILVPTVPFSIGASSSNTLNFLGNIVNVRWWDVEKSPANMATECDLPYPPPTDPLDLIGWYPLGDGAIFGGVNWLMKDESLTVDAISSFGMVKANRVNDIPPS